MEPCHRETSHGSNNRRRITGDSNHRRIIGDGNHRRITGDGNHRRETRPSNLGASRRHRHEMLVDSNNRHHSLQGEGGNSLEGKKTAPAENPVVVRSFSVSAVSVWQVWSVAALGFFWGRARRGQRRWRKTSSTRSMTAISTELTT
jgi:hypothetical protein